MPNKFILFITLMLTRAVGHGQETISYQQAAAYFAETKIVTHKNKSLWDLDIYAPILLVEPNSRKIFANEQDSVGSLQKKGNVFVGLLPASVNVANTSLKWNGKSWAMIMLPLPGTKGQWLNLVCHELFHRAQETLTLITSNADNKHLDERLGRVYLRLELEALRSAVMADKKRDAKFHVINALHFRRQRYELYPRADSLENLLELNEGLAEYTGVMMSERTAPEMGLHFSEQLEQFQKSKTFVRSFAYQTIPIYGYIAYLYVNKGWNKNITSKVNLTNYFEKVFGVAGVTSPPEITSSILARYNGDAIQKEEQIREEANLKLKAELIDRYVRQPHFEIRFEKMNISFSPNDIISLDEHGTVYPTIRVTDNWGILTVTGGALLSPNWNKITLTVPTEVGDNKALGDGWVLEINTGYEIIKENQSQNFTLKKR